MRMWDVNPFLLCSQHLLGEHLEMHMFAGTIKKGTSIKGYIEKGLVNPCKIKCRHDLLAREMKRRGMNHQSPLNLDCECLPEVIIDRKENLEELATRCPLCKERIEG